MFLKGYITQDLEPVLNDLFILGETKKKISLPAILDTGFNGELALPVHLKQSCQLIPLGVKSFELANGHIVEQETFLATLLINKKQIPIETTLTHSAIALVGMELIRNHVATFNLKTNRIFVK